ncbi:MAG: aldo/keto reductase [Candidatus Bathyarchaeota archaeon]|nr:MAG: aldo/keto reductase [Candidatus Bathyarchaeota archaeon]
MQYRILGQTGLKVSILGFGGIPIGRVDEKDAVAVVNHALDMEINFIHTSITYGDSAYKIGKVMEERRDECLLAVKIGGSQRTKEEAEERLKSTLEALNTDHVEIAELPINVHDFPKAMRPGGAYEAFEEAKKEGIIDHIGITSHDVDFLVEAIQTKAFSNLITPFNYAANSAKEELLSLTSDLDIGVIAMKTLGKGGLTNPSQALRYVWNHNIDTAIVGMNRLTEVEENVAVAKNPRALTEEEKEELREKAEDIVKTGRLSGSGSVALR